jgi:hypothetical protein
MTATPTLTPMPACAATGRSADEGGFVAPAAAAVVAVVVVDVVAVGPGVVAAEDLVVPVTASVDDEVGEEEVAVELDVELEEETADVCWRRTTTDEALASHLAQICGFGGRTGKRPLPLSQQPASPPSQQYWGSSPVTFEHEMRSFPAFTRSNVLVS